MQDTSFPVASRFRDPVTFEVFKNALMGLCEEMGLVIARTAHSSVITVSWDFSSALADPEGRVVVQSNDVMSHLGAYPYALESIRKKLGDRIYPGDIYIFNDTDEISTHLNDIFLVQPCFLQDELIGYTMIAAHHVDVGGNVAGSMSIESSELFQEGLQIPVVKLYERGEPTDVMDIILRNVRLPRLIQGDLQGQLAALHAGERGLMAIVERFSLERYRELSEELLDYAELLTASAIERIPDGTYAFEDWVDDDGRSPDYPPIPLQVKIIVSGDSIVVDWEGTADQVESSINVHLTHTRGLSYGAIMGVLGVEIPNNEGFYRKITVQAPEGSIVNVRRPAARSMRAALVFRIMDTLLGALHQAVPERVPACSCGGSAILQLSGRHPTRGLFVEGLSAWSGWGGRPGLDGVDFISPFTSNIAGASVEMTEQRDVVRFLYRGYAPDTGGAGRWRGCLSLQVGARVLVDDVVLRHQSYRHKSAPYGLAGGRSGTSSRLVVNPGQGDEVVLPGTATITLNKGDVFTYVHSSAGGYGDPLERDPHAVLNDVLDEKITAEYAAREYRVSVDERTRSVDLEQTEILRRTGSNPTT